MTKSVNNRMFCIVTLSVNSMFILYLTAVNTSSDVASCQLACSRSSIPKTYQKEIQLTKKTDPTTPYQSTIDNSVKEMLIITLKLINLKISKDRKNLQISTFIKIDYKNWNI